MEMLWAIFFTLVIKATGAPTSQNKRQHIIYEAKDVKDTWAESRPARNTDTINYNVPEDCEKECPEMYEPVCGTDGLTHHNKCKFKVSSCYKPEDNVTIHHLGECLRENEPYIRNNLIIDGNEIMNVGNNNDEAMLDSDGCWYHVLSKLLPYGTKGYDKCKQVQCQHDKDWHHTGERLPNCDNGSVKCWNWVTNETVTLESTMDFECNQYLCTEEDWVLSGERMSCEGCISVTTEEYLPQGFNGYWKCEQFECLKNNSWQKTGERLPGCSVGEVKCWDWNQNTTVPIGSEMIHNDMSLECTEEDWQKININVSSSAEIEGCFTKTTNQVYPYGTKGYYMCEQLECLGNNTWHKNGKTLSGCSLGEMKCLHWYNNEIVPLDSVMLHDCTQYICTDKDWKKTGNVNLSCLADGKTRCWDWHQDEGVPVNSVLIQDNIQYTCTEDDWKKTIILDPSSNYVPDDVAYVLHVTYYYIYPPLICLGVLANALCLCIITKPIQRLKVIHINVYIQATAIVDMVSSIFCIPAAIGQGCIFNSYPMAVYYTYFGWNIVNALRVCSLYTTLWISYDRFLAIWFHNKFQKSQDTKIVISRLSFSIIFPVLCFIPLMYSGELDEFKEGSWYSHPGYSINLNETWYYIYKSILVVFLQVLPGSFLIGLSVAIVVGLLKQKIGFNSTKNNRTFQISVTVLLINISYVVFTLPYSILAFFFFKKVEGRCYSAAYMEAWLSFVTSLFMLWHAFSTSLIFVFSKDYQKELRLKIQALKYFCSKDIDKNETEELESIDSYIELE